MIQKPVMMEAVITEGIITKIRSIVIVGKTTLYIEERCEAKVSRTVLKTSWMGRLIRLSLTKEVGFVENTQ